MVLLTTENFSASLATFIEPYTGLPLNIEHFYLRDEKTVALTIILPFPADRYQPILKEAISAHLSDLGEFNLDLKIHSTIASYQLAKGLTPIKGVKNIIAVASGKGGVGKSTTAVNLALALKQEGANVGILDADIYGPNQPLLLGANHEKPAQHREGGLMPVICHGLQSMSIGYLVDPHAAMIWRGPMVSGALLQLLNETRWSDLDYLIVDLPPGTGDVQLTLAQKMPVSGILMVTTPQEIALLDVHKAIKMFQKVNLPILGIVENMALHICKACGHQEPIFGTGGGNQLADAYSVPLLASFPLDSRIRAQADAGCPTVIAEPESALADLYHSLALSVLGQLSSQAAYKPAKFPKIIVSDT